ncbi:MAG TPA: EAL domain-containing protein [Burkholderiales bacterium]|nr:EAL domain-containing protein [Burkholderiales bacterium]
MATILVVDDRPSNRQFLTTLLGYDGHRLLEAADGAQALDLVRSERPDLVVTDILMPTMDGYEFVQRLRADAELAATPVIFYTASYSTPQAEALAKSCGVQKVLPKPAEPQAVLDAVNHALGASSPVQPPGAARAAEPAPGMAREIDDSMTLYLKDLDEVRTSFEDLVGRSGKLRSERESIKELSKKFGDNVAAMQRVTTRLSGLLEVGMEMMTERDPARLVELFFAAACDLIDSDYAAVGMLDQGEQTIRFVFAKGFDAGILGGAAGRTGLLETLLIGKRVLRMRSADGDAAAEGLPRGHPPVRDLLGLPVASAERVYGWIYFGDSRGAGGFSEEDARVGSVMTRKLALLYENAMLYDEIQRHAAQLQIEIGERRRMQVALAQSEAGLHRAQLMAKLAHVITAADGSFVSSSQTLPQLLGVAPDQQPRTTRAFLDLLHRDDQSMFRAKALDAAARRKRTELEYRLCRPDGELIRVRQTMEPLKADGDTTHDLHWFNTLQDVTDQRRIEESLRESESRFRQLAENIQEVFWLTDPGKNEILYVSPAYEQIWGRSCESVYASPRDWIEAIHVEDRARVLLAAQKQAAGNYDEEFRVVRPDGSIRWIRDRAFPVLRDGRVYRVTGIAEDITERKRAADELRESDRRFRDMLGKVELVSLMLDSEARITYCNDYLLRLTGWRREEVQGKDWFKTFIPPEEDLKQLFSDLIADLPSAWHHENEILTRVGERRLIRWHNSVLRSADGKVVGTASLGEDITDQKQAERKIQRLNRVYAVLSGINTLIVRARDRDELFRESCRIAVEHGRFKMVWIGVVDHAAGIVSPVASAGEVGDFFAAAPMAVMENKPGGHGLAGRAVRDMRPMVSNDVRADPQRLMRKELDTRGINSVAVIPLIVAGKALGVLALYAADAGFFDEEEMKLLVELAGDISFALDHLQKTERINYLAYYDELTGLANRALFVERLEQMMHEAHSSNRMLAVSILDIERFKSVNDAFGRQNGDRLLQEIAARMKAAGKEPVRMARIGSDLFAVASRLVQNEGEIVRVTEQRLQQIFEAPFSVAGQDFKVSVRIGIAIFPQDGGDSEALLRSAEAAVKNAKAAGERYLFFAKEMTARVADKLALESKLRQAIDKQELVLHYQPKVDLETRAVVGVEALIRWQSPDKGLVPPAHFIPLLEETGLILQAGAWALNRAARDHRRWVEQKLEAPRVAVNVSAIQLRQRDFVGVVEQAITDGVAPTAIDLEITESLVMEDIKGNIEKLKAVRALGVNIAIDDFGTGYSSLGYLARLPVQSLKIDRSFIIKMGEDPNAMTLVSTIISLAHSLRLKVIAEGVETEDQAKFLRLLRCDEMQGYLFSKPVPADQLVALLKAGSGL